MGKGEKRMLMHEKVAVTRDYHVCDVCGVRITLTCHMHYCRICGAELCGVCAHFVDDGYPRYCPKCFTIGTPFFEEELAEDRRHGSAIKDILERWRQAAKDAEDGVGHA